MIPSPICLHWQNDRSGPCRRSPSANLSYTTPRDTIESVPQPDASRASPGKSNDSQYVPCELKPGPPLTFAPCGRAINIDLNKLNKNIIKNIKPIYWDNNLYYCKYISSGGNPRRNS